MLIDANFETEVGGRRSDVGTEGDGRGQGILSFGVSDSEVVLRPPTSDL